MKYLYLFFVSMIVLSFIFGFTFPHTQTTEPISTIEPTIPPTIEPTATVEPLPTPPPEVPLPPTNDTSNLVNGVTALIAALGGLLGSILTNLIKQIPGLSEGDKSKLSGAAAEIVAVVVSALTGFVLAWGAQGLGLVNDSSTQALLIALAAPLVAEARYRVVKLGK